MSIPSITAAYTVASTGTADIEAQTGSPSASVSGSLTFETPLVLSNDAASLDDKEKYLSALAKALSTLQESINTGLTERLVKQGVLSESNTTDPAVNTKLRTKVPGQPNNNNNNNKKGQTKKQQQQQQKQRQQQEKKTDETPAPATTTEVTTSATTAPETTSLSTGMDIDASTNASSSAEILVSKDEDMERAYKPRGGIYGDDEEDEEKEKDEVDLVMEADPGEVDGACLELPKDADQQQQQQQQNKKRNELPTEISSDAAATKKSKGSEDA
ncbi:hypothetical protein BGX28_000166 [Mortierella sp. GBA30]|nr:hypothetical protein BGX28_000166 [Mortierella sp. GBA30]